MSDIFYRNFDMQILRAGDEYLAQTESQDAGNASLNFTLPFSEDGLEALLSKLGPARRVRGVETPIEAAKRLGGQLYKAVFSAGIGSALDRSIEAAKRDNERVRIRLRLTNAPELANLPWEYLYDELNDRFLALSYKTSIVRYLETPQSVNLLAVKPPLRALVMASSPIGYDALGVDKEWSNLQTALGKMPRGLLEVDRTEKATLEALQERLSGGNQYHIFHYIGHGGFDPRTGKSVLVMEDDRRQARFVDGPQLGVLLHNHPSLRLAILNACEGAVANQNDVFTGVAQNLIKQEIPAVIAMQFEITDSVAIILAKAFYESLARSAPMDTALAEARLAVFAADDGIEWGTPVLYLRAPDGRLFDVEDVEPQPTPMPFIKPYTPPTLRQSSFETVTLDSLGNETSRRRLQAMYFVEDLDGAPLEMVKVPGGEFTMGSPVNEAERGADEGPQHPVIVSEFFMGRYEITQAQWRVVAGWKKVERELNPAPSRFKGDNRPVENVRWEDAVEFCKRLVEKTGNAYRLPTEAEWEYGCRAGTNTPFAFGETISPGIVNYNSQYPYGKAKKEESRSETVPVGSLGAANAFGLYDMHGNVWEWCLDWYSDQYYEECRRQGVVRDPQGPEFGQYHVLRGGSWLYQGGLCRSALRDFYVARLMYSLVGLRVLVSRLTPPEFVG